MVAAIHVHGPSYRFPDAGLVQGRNAGTDGTFGRDGVTAAMDRIAADVVAAAARVSGSLRQAG